MLRFFPPVLDITSEILKGLDPDDPKDRKEIADVADNDDELEDAQGIGDQKDFFDLVVIEVDVVRKLAISINDSL